MSRMKTFFKYLICFVLLFIFVSFMSFEFAKASYKDLINYKIDCSNPQITISEAKATRVNGYINGKIKSTENEKENEYIKIDLISKNKNIITSKYIDISELVKDQEKEFSIKFDAENIVTFNMIGVKEKDMQKSLINTEDILPLVITGGVLLWAISVI